MVMVSVCESSILNSKLIRRRYPQRYAGNQEQPIAHCKNSLIFPTPPEKKSHVHPPESPAQNGPEKKPTERSSSPPRRRRNGVFFFLLGGIPPPPLPGVNVQHRTRKEGRRMRRHKFTAKAGGERRKKRVSLKK